VTGFVRLRHSWGGRSVNALRPYVPAVLRRSPLIALVTLIAVAATGYWGYTTAKPTWTATTA
jgi:hypothetical protein